MTVETRDRELRTSEEKYQRLFESLSDGAALLLEGAPAPATERDPAAQTS